MSGIIGGAGSKSGVIGDNDLKEYDMTVTHTNWTTGSAIVIPYKTINGDWWVKGNVHGTLASYGNNNVFGLTTAGVTWVDNSAFTVRWNSLQSTAIEANGGFHSSNQMVVIWNGTASANGVWHFAFDVKVQSRPTLMD